MGGWSTPCPRCSIAPPLGKDPVPLVQQAGLDRCGKSFPNRDSIPGPSSPYQVAILTELSQPTHITWNKYKKIYRCKCHIMHKGGGGAANEVSSHSYCFAPHLFKWIPIQTVNWAVCQCCHHVTRGRHGCGNRQFGCCDANHRGWRHEVGLVLPQLQK